jgi:N4-gp56 family major capsid protein
MANEFDTGVSGADALYANIMQAALFTMNEQSIIRPLVRNYNMTGTPGLTAQVPIYPAVSASGVSDGSDLSNVSFATTKKEITASEVGVMVTLTDLLEEASSDDTAAAVGRQLGAAMAEKVDTDIAALFSGFSNVINKSSASVTVDDLFKAAATLKANKADQNGGYVAVLHPYQAYDLKLALTNAGYQASASAAVSDVGNRALESGFIGRVAGIDIFESTVINGADSVGSYFGAVMTQDALGYMLKRDMRIETQRDASLRATEIVGSMAYGVTELFDQYGVAIQSDATAVI